MVRSPNSTTDFLPSIGHHYNVSVISPYLQSNWKVLDIGCWTGQLYRAFATPPKNYYGLDIVDAAAAIMEANRLSPKGHWRIGSALNLPYPAHSFHLVTLLDVLEHVQSGTESICLTQIHRVLKPSGLLIFSTPADNLVSKLADPAYLLMGHRHYSTSTLVTLFTHAGFKVSRHWTTGGWWHIGYYWLHLAYKHLFHFSAPTLAAKAGAELGRPGFLTHYFVLHKPC